MYRAESKWGCARWCKFVSVFCRLAMGSDSAELSLRCDRPEKLDDTEWWRDNGGWDKVDGNWAWAGEAKGESAGDDVGVS